MGQNTEELTTTPRDIEATRADLSRNIDELTDKVSPQRVIERRKEAARGRIGSVRDKVMGTASQARSGVTSAGGSATGSVSDTASSAVSGVQARTEGNPLAAGVVAFGAGMLISALLPASDKETEAARRVVEAAKEHGQPVVDQAKSIGQDIGDNLKESAAQAADEVKSTAQDSIQTVKQEGQSSADTVRNETTSTSTAY